MRIGSTFPVEKCPQQVYISTMIEAEYGSQGINHTY